jgi:hypothetical protein
MMRNKQREMKRSLSAPFVIKTKAEEPTNQPNMKRHLSVNISPRDKFKSLQRKNAQLTKVVEKNKETLGLRQFFHQKAGFDYENSSKLMLLRKLQDDTEMIEHAAKNKPEKRILHGVIESINSNKNLMSKSIKELEQKEKRVKMRGSIVKIGTKKSCKEKTDIVRRETALSMIDAELATSTLEEQGGRKGTLGFIGSFTDLIKELPKMNKYLSRKNIM